MGFLLLKSNTTIGNHHTCLVQCKIGTIVYVNNDSIFKYLRKNQIDFKNNLVSSVDME